MAFRASVLAATLLALVLPASAQATEPWPCLYVYDYAEFATPREGEPQLFDAGCTTDVDGHDIVLYEWDLDGDGTFETSSGSSPLLVHTFESRAAFPDALVDFGWKVTDAAGESASYTWPLRITDRINSWFNYAPQLVNPGDALTLDGSTAYQGPLASPVFTYSWDLDGDGAFETSTGAVSTTSLVAPDTTGLLRVGLRVSDGIGNASTVNRDIEVLPRHPSRDQQPWDAPENLLQAPPVSQQATEVREAVVAPIGPDMPAVEPAQTPRAAQPRFRLRKVDGNKHGVKIVLGGPKRTRWHITLRLPAERAAGYGLPRRTVVFARGLVRFDGRGIGRLNMRWTKSAYRVFRRVRYGLLDIVPRRA